MARVAVLSVVRVFQRGVTVEAVLIADLLCLGAGGEKHHSGYEEGHTGEISHEISYELRIPIQHSNLNMPVE